MRAILTIITLIISYLDECDRERSRHSRQKILRENYLFTDDLMEYLSRIKYQVTPIIYFTDASQEA